MGRPPKDPQERKQRITITLDPEIRRQLAALVDNGYYPSVSGCVQDLVKKEYMARFPRGKKDYIEQEKERIARLEAELGKVEDAHEQAVREAKDVLEEYHQQRERWAHLAKDRDHEDSLKRGFIRRNWEQIQPLYPDHTVDEVFQELRKDEARELLDKYRQKSRSWSKIMPDELEEAQKKFIDYNWSDLQLLFPDSTKEEVYEILEGIRQYGEDNVKM